MRRISLNASAILGVVASIAGGNQANATDYTVPPTTTAVNLSSGGDTLTVAPAGTLSVAGVPVVSTQATGDTEIDNEGQIISNLAGTTPLTPAIGFAAFAGTSLSIDNSGLIRGRRGSALAVNQTASRTGSIDFNNSGTIESFTNGGSITLGAYTGQLALQFGTGDDTLTNSGEITGDIFMGLGDDTVNILTGSNIHGWIYGDDGSNLGTDTDSSDIIANGGTINFIGSINTQTSEQVVNGVELFRNVHFVSGYWTLNQNIYGGIFTVDAGATVEMRDDDLMFREFVYTAFNDLGTPLVNNGHIVFYNDLTTYSTDDGLNINITGTGSLDLYNTAGDDGVFQFGASGGFGGGLNLHGGTVLLVADYTGNINVLDGGILRIGGNLIDDPQFE